MYNRKLLTTLLSLFLLITLVSGEAEAQKNKKYKEDLSSDRPTFVKNENNKEPENTTVTSPAEDITGELEEILTKQALANKDMKHAVGYRVYVFSGRDRSAFNEAKYKVYKTLPDAEVYESYSNPTYKIKAGDFIDKIEAFAAYKKVKEEFPAAQLIKEKVNIR